VKVEGYIVVGLRLVCHHVLEGVVVDGIAELSWQGSEEWSASDIGIWSLGF
jgi:hypothetical protein